MQSDAKDIDDYLARLDDDRRPHVARLLQTIRQNIPAGFVETMTSAMPGFVVPHKRYPAGYHVNPASPLPFVNVASQKKFIALYHMGMYASPELHNWFVAEYPKHAKRKLDMGKSCVRFKSMADIPFDLVGELMAKMSVDDWITRYESKLKR